MQNRISGVSHRLKLSLFLCNSSASACKSSAGRIGFVVLRNVTAEQSWGVSLVMALVHAIAGVNGVHLVTTFSRSVGKTERRENSRLRINVASMKGSRIRAKRQYLSDYC